jgi:hypothetical protein
MTICRAVSRLMIGGLLCTLGSGWVVASATATQESNANPYAIRIDISKPVLHLYREGKLYRTFPIALGTIETPTPIGKWRIVDKHKNWGSGFGTRWMGLDVPWGMYGIHGTNRPEFIGQYVSNGCIRMLNPDVEWLYDWIPIGTSVIITGNPLAHLRILKLGNIGADVQWVQQRLKQAGYFRGDCDGKFDGGMQFSLFYFELARGLTPDGVVGMDDYQALGLKRLHSKSS